MNQIAGNYIPKAVPSVYPLPVRAGCVLDLDMQDSGDRIADNSGRGNHGTNAGSVPVAGLYGAERSFDGVDDQITLPAINPSGSITFECWFRCANIALTQVLCYLPDGANADYFVVGLYNSRILSSGDNTSGTSRSSGPLVSNNWYHLVATKTTGTAQKVYVNGVDVTAAAGTYFGGALITVAKLGRGDESNSFKFLGRLGIARLYNYVLSEAEIQAAYRENAWRYGQ